MMMHFMCTHQKAGITLSNDTKSIPILLNRAFPCEQGVNEYIIDTIHGMVNQQRRDYERERFTHLVYYGKVHHLPQSDMMEIFIVLNYF